jgi:hypothetical protein
MANPCGGSTSPLEEYDDWLLPLVAEQPDWIRDEMVAAMCKQRIPDSRKCANYFKHAGYGLK